MDTSDIQKKCDAFLNTLDVPGVVLFGWQKDSGKYNFVYSYRKVPRSIIIKGLAWAISKLAEPPKRKDDGQKYKK